MELVVNNNEHEQILPLAKGQVRLNKTDGSAILIGHLKYDDLNEVYYTYLHDEEYKQTGLTFKVKNKKDKQDLEKDFPLVITESVLSFGVK